MKVAICYTKRRTDEIMESFTKGVVSSGDHVELIKSKSDLHKLERCDVSFQIAEVTRYESLCYHSDPHGMAEEGYMRVAIKNKMIELGRQRVMLDCGILDDDRNRDPNERYYSIGVDGIKRGANFYNENSPNDRFKKRKKSPENNGLLKKVIEEANIELKANAIKTGANAVLGYDLNLTTTNFGSKNFVLVSVSGTAVETA